MRTVVLVVSLVLLVACGTDRPLGPNERSHDQPPELVALGEDVTPLPVTARRAHMHARFETVDLARSALMRGDLSAVRSVASTIAFRIPVDLPRAARLHGDRVPRRALALSAAEDLPTAASAFAALVGTCGACHAETGASWSWEQPPLPEGDDLGARMQRHAWAHERMWEALLVASPERFDRAADILAVDPISGDAPPDEEHPEGIRAIEERLRDAARDARDARTMDDRIEIYGRIIATCAGCHARIREIE
ncbi:MAG: hypothetical protein M3Y87_31435 [Myxococcota bacterium]|nr:hypothetical protein [Myxococcota bacterium]